MAAEQLAGDGTVSPRTDLYGLGAVLRVLLADRPAEVEPACRRCLAVDPADRFASAEELAIPLRLLASRPG